MHNTASKMDRMPAALELQLGLLQLWLAILGT